MTRTNELTRDDLVRFVRGEKSWRMLLSRGIDIQFIERKVKAKSKGEPVVCPTMEDVAAGFTRFRGDETALREWAAVMLSIGEIELDRLDAESEGEVLKEALWDASFGEGISKEASNLIGRLTKPTGQQ